MSEQNFTPREIVDSLDRFIIGQDQAKRCVAVALRNRWRRQQVPRELRDEIAPKNIIMMGPTGVGKTEIARRLAALANSPFLKVEATKFTEVGYVGRDVESMVRDLLELTIKMVKEEKMVHVMEKADVRAEERVLDLLLPGSGPVSTPTGQSDAGGGETREKLRTLLRSGELDDREVEIHIQERSSSFVEIFSGPGTEGMDINLKDMMGRSRSGRPWEFSHRKRLTNLLTWTLSFRRPSTGLSRMGSSSWTRSTRSSGAPLLTVRTYPGKGSRGICFL